MRKGTTAWFLGGGGGAPGGQWASGPPNEVWRGASQLIVQPYTTRCRITLDPLFLILLCCFGLSPKSPFPFPLSLLQHTHCHFLCFYVSNLQNFPLRFNYINFIFNKAFIILMILILILRLKLKASNYDLLPFKSFKNFVIDRKIVF